MAFVIEKIPQDVQFDINVFHAPFMPELRPIEHFKWVVDRERNAFLVRLGGGGPWEHGQPKPQEYWALKWKGGVVKFSTRRSDAPSEQGPKSVSHWTVSDLKIVVSIRADRDEFRQLITEGLAAMGDELYQRQSYVGVDVNFE